MDRPANKHATEELRQISNMRRRNPHAGLAVFWVKLRLKGCKRSITGLYRVLKRQGMQPVKPPKLKYIPKPHEQMTYPGQSVRIDINHVPIVRIAAYNSVRNFNMRPVFYMRNRNLTKILLCGLKIFINGT